MAEHADMADVGVEEELQRQTPVILDEEASEPFVGRWQQLVSQTNWEKGRILIEWRRSLEASGAPAGAYSDEAWSRLVGGVTPQHVGRLRRVALRFGDSYGQYPGVYWSHFFAALEWEDAEMWLEGAVQNDWSVSGMRRMRAETLGEIAEESRFDQPQVAEPDEDFEPLVSLDGAPDDSAAQAVAAPPEQLRDEAVERSRGEQEEDAADEGQPPDEAKAAPAVRPFADLPELPEDLAEAFDAFKLAILAHKTKEWREVSCADVLASLEALKTLATAP